VLIKQGQRFGVVCETEMSATRNSFVALNLHEYKKFCWTMAGKLCNLRLKQHGLTGKYLLL